jgi:hypothetical protein
MKQSAQHGLNSKFGVFGRTLFLQSLMTCLFLVLAAATAVGQTFNVKDFGAIGNGVSDDTDAIRAAIAEAGSWADANSPEIATIYFPEGTYAVAPKETDPRWESNKPAIFDVPASNLHFIGDGPDKSIISCYTIGLNDPNTHWTVIDDGFGYFKIKRGSCFRLPQWQDPRNNLRFEGLRITGNTDGTGDNTVGGTSARHGVVNGLINSYKGKWASDSWISWAYSDGTLIRFGKNKNQPPEIVPQKAYYVVNSTGKTFQISETPGGEPVHLSDTINDSEHRFISTDGNGWNMGHSAMDLGSEAFENLVIENCHLDRWRGEIIHAGGDNPRTVTIRNSVIEHSNASMVSVPSLVMEDTILRHGYNGVENYARKPWHKAEIRRCEFIGSRNNQFGEKNAIAYLGSPDTGAIIENNTIRDWKYGVLLSEVANNIEITGNDILGVKHAVVLSRLGLYPNDPWSSFDNIHIAKNDFRTYTGGHAAIFVQLGDISNKNFLIEENVFHPGETDPNSRWSLVIQDFGPRSLENREGFIITRNQVHSGADFRRTRAIWKDNIRTPLWQWGKRFTWYRDPSGPIEITFDSNHVWGRNLTDNTEIIDVTLDPSVFDFYPEGYSVELVSTDKKSWRVLADPAWNTFTADVLVEKGNPVWLIVGADGRFSLMHPENHGQGGSGNPDPDNPEQPPGEDPDAENPPLDNPEPEEPTVDDPGPEDPSVEDPKVKLEPPSAPRFLVSQSASGALEISWQPDATIDSVEIQARSGGPFYQDLATYDGSSTAAIFTSLEAGRDYQFRLRAVRGEEVSEWISSEVVKFLGVGPNPITASDIRTEITNAGDLVLSLVSVLPAQGYEIQIAEGAGEYESLGEFSADQLEVEITDLLPAVNYSIRLRTQANGQYSEWMALDPLTVAGDDFEPVHYWSMDYLLQGKSRGDGKLPMDLEVESPLSRGPGIGKSNSGILFSGDHDGLVIPDSENINLAPQTALTISLWVRPDASMVDKTSVLYEQGGYWRGLNILLERGWLVAGGWNRPSKESDWSGTVLSGGRLVMDEWNHIVLVLNGEESVREDALILYANGQRVASGAGSMLWAQADATGIGQVAGSTVYLGREVRRLHPFKGSIDDVAIWQTAYQAETVEALALAGYNLGFL